MKVLRIMGRPELTVLTFLEALFSLVMGAIYVSGVDRGGDLPGLLRFLWFIVNGVIWAFVFMAVLIVSVPRGRHFPFLYVTGFLIVARIVFFWFQEGWEVLNHIYVCFPVEGFVYLFWGFETPLRYKIRFTIANLSLYGAQASLWLI